jgi:glycosyltransferase involved in cell wall biosynthesis
MDKIILTKHSIDTHYFAKVSSKGLKDIRERINISDEDLMILFAGFITPRKGLEYLAKAMHKLHPIPKLVIVGKWRNQAYRNYLTGLFDPIRTQVIETGFVDDDQMPLYYSLADVYVSPSLMEGFGLPLGESLACETPVVAFDVGATAEVVGPGGILVPPRDVDGLANAINYLLQNPEVRQAMGKEGRQHILREFSVEAMLSSTLEAYRRFLGVHV